MSLRIGVCNSGFVAEVQEEHTVMQDLDNVPAGGALLIIT